MGKGGRRHVLRAQLAASALPLQSNLTVHRLLDDSVFSDGIESEPCFNYWPNPVSQANSDTSLQEHHEQIIIMRPKVLVITFMNGWYEAVARSALHRILLDPGALS